MAKFEVASLGEYIREQRHAAQLSLRQLASSAGVSNPYLSQVERGLRNPSAEILGQIAKALRISAETLYVRAGLLEERDAYTSVTFAIAEDPELTPRQRRVLLEIYASFQAENKNSGELQVTTNEPQLVVGGDDASESTAALTPSPRTATDEEMFSPASARQRRQSSTGDAQEGTTGTTRSSKKGSN